MGYDVHITRASEWLDNAGHEISIEEWRAAVSKDPTLTPASDWETAGDVAWSGSESGDHFWYSDGNIDAKNPSRSALLKMLDLADVLGARVQGDDGEIYTRDNLEPRVERVTPTPWQRLRNWWVHIRQPRMSLPSMVRVGARVRNPYGVVGTVIRIDDRGPLGSIVIRNENGVEVGYTIATWNNSSTVLSDDV